MKSNTSTFHRGCWYERVATRPYCFRLVFAFRLLPSFLTSAFLLLPSAFLDAQEVVRREEPEFRTFATAHFRLHAPGDDWAALAHEYGALFEDAARELAAPLGLTLGDQPIDVFLFPGRNAFRSTRITDVTDLDEDAVAVTGLLQRRVALAVLPSTRARRRQVRREVVSLLVFQHFFPGPVHGFDLFRLLLAPEWALAGLREWALGPGEAERRTEVLRDLVARRAWPDLARLHGFASLRRHEQEEAVQYARGAFEYLEARWGRATLGDLVRGWKGHWGPGGPFEPVLGIGLDDFQRDYRAWLERHAEFGFRISDFGVRPAEAPDAHAESRSRGEIPPLPSASPRTSSPQPSSLKPQASSLHQGGFYRRHALAPMAPPNAAGGGRYFSTRDDRLRLRRFGPDEDGEFDDRGGLTDPWVETRFDRYLARPGDMNSDGRLAVVVERANLTHLALLDPDGFGLELHRPAVDGRPVDELLGARWAPHQGDGGQATLVLTVQHRGRSDVLHYDPATRTGTLLTDDRWADADGQLTPDGRTLVFRSERGGRWGLYERDLDTGAEREHFFSAEDVTALDLSPDGRRIAVACDRDGVSRLFGLDRDTGRWVRLDWRDQGQGARGGFGLRASDQAGGTATLKPEAWSLEPEGTAAFAPRWLAGAESGTGTGAGTGTLLIALVWRAGRSELAVFTVPPAAWDEDAAVAPDAERPAPIEPPTLDELAAQPFTSEWNLDYLLPLGLFNTTRLSDTAGHHELDFTVSLGLDLRGSLSDPDINPSAGAGVEGFYLYRGLRPDLGAALFAHASGDEDRRTGEYGGRLFARHPFTSFDSLSFGYRLSQFRERRENPFLPDERERRGGVSLALAHDTLRVRHQSVVGGWALRGQTTFYREWMLASVNTHRFFVEALGAWELWDDHVIGARAAFVRASNDAPRFGPGGAGGVRGVDSDEFLGRRLFVTTLEYHFPIRRGVDWGNWIAEWRDLHGYVFHDAGFNRWGETAPLPVTDRRTRAIKRGETAPPWLSAAGWTKARWLRSYGVGLQLDVYGFQRAGMPMKIEFQRVTDPEPEWRFSIGMVRFLNSE